MAVTRFLLISTLHCARFQDAETCSCSSSVVSDLLCSLNFFFNSSRFGDCRICREVMVRLVQTARKAIGAFCGSNAAAAATTTTTTKQVHLSGRNKVLFCQGSVLCQSFVGWIPGAGEGSCWRFEGKQCRQAWMRPFWSNFSLQLTSANSDFILQELFSTANSIPFTIIVGQEEMTMCLKWNAIEPDVGGLMIASDRGTGKFTTVRALARRSGRETGKQAAADCHFPYEHGGPATRSYE